MIFVMTDKPKPLYENLPTGKPHVSFSEIKCWKDCSFRHHLIHIEKKGVDTPAIPLSFGTAVHAALEQFLKTRTMDIEICHASLRESWAKNKDVVDKEGAHVFSEDSLKKAVRDSEYILSEFSEFLKREFSEWEFVASEHSLYEKIDRHPHAFKGFIDGVIKARGKRGETLHWILDHKTSQSGWRREKRSDDTLKYQLALYKNFWLQKNPELKFKDVRGAFVILKRNAKPGNHCELFTVSLGDKTVERAVKAMNNMISSVKRGVYLKNRDSCKFCEFYQTELCT